MSLVQRPRHPYLTLALLGVAALAGAAATAAGVHQVHVRVIRDGQPVRGLGTADFEVRTRGKQAAVLGVEEVESAPRRVLFLFDLSFSAQESVAVGRQAATAVVDDLEPTDLVGVFLHDRASGLRTLLAPTADRDRVLAALDALPQASRPPGAVRDAVARADGEDLASAVGSVSSNHSRSVVTVAQGQIHGLIKSLAGLARGTRDTADESHVVLFSEGFDSSLIHGHPGTRRVDGARAMEDSTASALGETWRVNGASRFAAGYVETALFEMLADFRRLGSAIHTVDLSGSAPDSGRQRGARGLSSLYLLADESGGERFRDPERFSEDFATALGPASPGYVLAFERRARERRGRHLPLDVRLSGPGRGVEVAHRPSVYSPR